MSFFVGLKSADGRIQVGWCRKSRKQSNRLFGTQGTQKRARTETFPGLAKLSLRGICPLGCVIEITRNPEKKWIDLQKENCLSWKGNLMFNNMHCVSFFRSLEGRGKGKRVSNYGSVFHPRRRSTKILSFPLCLSVMYFSAQGMCPCLVGCLPEGNWLALI